MTQPGEGEKRWTVLSLKTDLSVCVWGGRLIEISTHTHIRSDCIHAHHCLLKMGKKKQKQARRDAACLSLNSTFVLEGDKKIHKVLQQSWPSVFLEQPVISHLFVGRCRNQAALHVTPNNTMTLFWSIKNNFFLWTFQLVFSSCWAIVDVEFSASIVLCLQPKLLSLSCFIGDWLQSFKTWTEAAFCVYKDWLFLAVLL